MTKYRDSLPQAGDELFLTDGGLETTLIFHEGVELPCFASFVLADDEGGRERLRAYYRRYAEVARAQGVSAVFDTATWRANADWGARLGYSDLDLARANKRAVEVIAALRDEVEHAGTPIVIGGCLGPRADGYQPGKRMSAEQARRYHEPQIRTLKETAADLVSAATLNYVEEALGVARAAAEAEMPLALSFTVETDGKLPTGTSLREAIETVDREGAVAPAYYMVNCAHPTHFEHVLRAGEPWTRRVRGLRVNASALSHAELDARDELDEGDPRDLGERCAALRRRLPHLNVFGGCCGTDHRHVERIGAACFARA